VREPYDPTWLVELARRQHADRPELAAALARCTRCVWESAGYVYFVEPPRTPNTPGSPWQFQENVLLEDEAEGTIVLDVLQSGEIGGAEFLSRL